MDIAVWRREQKLELHLKEQGEGLFSERVMEIVAEVSKPTIEYRETASIDEDTLQVNVCQRDQGN